MCSRMETSQITEEEFYSISEKGKVWKIFDYKEY